MVWAAARTIPRPLPPGPTRASATAPPVWPVTPATTYMDGTPLRVSFPPAAPDARAGRDETDAATRLRTPAAPAARAGRDEIDAATRLRMPAADAAVRGESPTPGS